MVSNDWDLEGTGYTISDIVKQMQLGESRISVAAHQNNAALGECQVSHNAAKPLLLVKVDPQVTKSLIATQRIFPTLGYEAEFVTGFFATPAPAASVFVMVTSMGGNAYAAFFDLQKEDHLVVAGKLAAGVPLMLNLASEDTAGNVQEVIFGAPVDADTKEQFYGALQYIRRLVFAKNTLLWNDADFEEAIAKLRTLPASELAELLKLLRLQALQQGNENPLFDTSSN